MWFAGARKIVREWVFVFLQQMEIYTRYKSQVVDKKYDVYEWGWKMSAEMGENLSAFRIANESANSKKKKKKNSISPKQR